jgi:hypothetical protein
LLLGLAQLSLDGQRKGHRLRRLSPRGDARWPSAKRQGGPDPPETKVGVSFPKRAATIECKARPGPRRRRIMSFDMPTTG